MNSSLINLKLIFVFLLLFVSINTYSANRFWIAGSASNWNNTANWSTTSGGAGGASVPVATDQVFFNANGVGNCNIDAAVNIESIQVNAGYTGAIDLLGFSFTINGTNNNVFAGGTINDTPASSFISVTTTGTTTYSGTVFNTGNTVSSGRFNFNGGTFNIASTFTKTGAGNDNSPGGNTFSQDMVFINNSINYLLLGNGTADIFNGNVTLTNNGSNNMYIAHNGAGHSIAGNLILNNNATGAGDYRMFVCAGNTAALTINGNVTVLQNGNATTLRTYFGDQGDIILNGKLNATISGSGTTSDFRIANNTNSLVTISDTLTILNNGSATNNNSYIGNVGDVILNGKVNLTNSGSGTTSQIIVGNNPTSQITIAGICDIVNNNNANTTNRCYLGNQGDVTFNGDLNIINNAGSANSEVYCNYQVNSNNLYNENITVSTTNTTCDGIYFGQNNGSGTLANNKTITIPGVDTVNFVGGQIRFRNFTQTGNTAQSLELASTATYIYNYDANWGGNISFTAPRIVSRGTTYNGTANIEKTGAGSDGSIGGNTFSGALTLTNSGSGYLLFGNGTADIFQSNVNLINSGSNNLYIAYDGAGHTITGDLVTTNSATGAGDYRIFCGTTTNTTLTINGNVTLNNTGNGTTIRTYFPNQADLTLNGTLTINNSATGTNSYMQIADGANSSLSISGLTTVNNNNTATTNNRIYLGNNGDITFNGVLDLINNSAATNSDIYCNYGANSQNLYNENITVSSTNINSDGISFGRGNGSGILAATKTITIPGVDTVNFIGGDLYFRNFTQTGPTPHSFELASTAVYIYNYDSDWGGNADFRSPRMYTRGTTYNGTAHLEKTGGIGDDAGAGGNTFVGNLTLVNSGSRYIMTGNGTFDTFQANVNLINSGTSNIYLAHNGAGHIISGDLTATNSAIGTGTCQILIANSNTATLTVNGNTTINHDGSATTLRTYFGDQGDISQVGNLSITNAGTGTTSDIRVANNANSLITITGNTSLVNSNTATTTNRIYLGNQGDIIFNGTLDISNNASTVNSEIFCNHGANSTNLYNENITVSTGIIGTDGIYFGNGTGNGTLAATKTITIPGVDTTNFIGGSLYFRNFTQIGPTPHNFELASTAVYIQNYDSDWGGDVDFRSPRMYTRGTTYNGTAHLEKTGGIGDDTGPGGNTFVGDLTLTNSGSRYVMTGNGTFDSFQANVNLINTGTSHIYLAHNGAGHSIAGNLTSTNSGTGASRIYVANANAATLTINGNAVLTNNGNGNALYTYFGGDGDITLTGPLTMTNSGTGTTSEMRVADNLNSTVTLNNIATFINNNTATTTSRLYIGRQGDIIFNGDLTITNNANCTNSEVYCNHNANSNNLYNENIIVETTAAGSDGIRFGEGAGFGTLAANKTVTIGGGGFVSGRLMFRNFTQTGPTAQTLQPTGTTLFYNYDSQWNGNVDFRSPRHLTQGTTYNGTAFLEKNGATNDASAGGNTFNNDVTFQNIGTDYFMPANGTSNDFNANATYIKSSTGLMYPSYNCTSTYAGNITINANSTIRFGAAGNGRVLFDGNSAQSINIVGATPTPEFRDIQTNNLISDITLNTPVIVLTELDLDNGHIITSSSNLLTMNDNSIVSSAGELAFVDGPMRKVGNDAFDFPVGKNDTAYAPISISAPVGGGHHFTAEYFQINPDSVLPTPYTRFFKDASLNHVSGCEYWILDRTNGASNVDVTLSWDDRSCGVSNLGDLRVARWDGAMWRDHGNGGTTGSNANGTVVTSGPVTTFSPFTLASSTNENPLPIELLSFTAELANNVVELNWITSTEINNDYFTLQKSKDALNWIDFAEQEGAGNTNTTISYTDVDYNPFTGTSYYRLKQTDFNGAFSYSHIETITNTKQQINIYPNPTVSELNISNIKANDIVQVFAIDGRLIYNGNSAKIDASNWSKGIYEVVIFNTSNEILERSKIVKQ